MIAIQRCSLCATTSYDRYSRRIINIYYCSKIAISQTFLQTSLIKKFFLLYLPPSTNASFLKIRTTILVELCQWMPIHSASGAVYCCDDISFNKKHQVPNYCQSTKNNRIVLFVNKGKTGKRISSAC